MDYVAGHIIDHDSGGNPAEVAKPIFQTADETLTGLSPNHFAVGFARMAQHAPEEMRPSAFAIFDDPRSLAEVDLQFLAGLSLHSPHRQLASGEQPAHETLYRVIASSKAMFGR